MDAETAVGTYELLLAAFSIVVFALGFNGGWKR